MRAPNNPLDAVTHPDPYPYYATLRNGPSLVFMEPLRLWVAASAAAVTEALDNRACRVRPAAEPVPQAIAGSASGEVFGYLIRMNDGEKHDTPKFAIERALAAIDLQHVYARGSTLATQLAAKHSALCGPALTAWAFAVPVFAVAETLGFAEHDLPQVAAWTAEFVACLSPLSTPPQLLAASASARDLAARFSKLVAQASVVPGHTLLAAVLQHVQHVGWTDGQAVLCNLIGLLSQTYEATAGLIANSVVALAAQQNVFDAVRAKPGLIAPLVEEVTRYDPSVQNTRRFVAERTAVAGVELDAGEAILLCLAAANRDPQLNPQPEAFDLRRANRQQLTFGRGKHACPGGALACTIAAAAINALLEADFTPQHLSRGWTYRASLNARIPIFNA